MQKNDQQMAGFDNLWLQVEHPRRLMTVFSLWMFKHDLQVEQVGESLEKLCKEFPRFTEVAVGGNSFHTATWAKADPWCPIMNVVRHNLEKPTEACLQEYMNEELIKPFDPERPLWQLHVISGLKDGRSAVFWKAHHALSDGEGFIKSILAVTSFGGKDDQPVMVAHSRKAPTVSESAPVYPITDYTLSIQLVKDLFNFFVLWSTFWLNVIFMRLYSAWIILEHDIRMTLICILPIHRHDLYYSGTQKSQKEISWSDSISIDDVRIVREAFHGTLNDMMLVVVTRSIKSYIESVSTRKDNYARILIPLSLRKPDDWSTRNVVSGAWGWFSMKDLDTKSMVKQVQREMSAIKASYLPQVYYQFVQNVMGLIPGIMPPMPVVNIYADIPHAVFTNVPGPTTPITFGGQEVEEFRLCAPLSGKGGIGIGLASYCGRLTITAQSDCNPDYPHIAEGVCKRFVKEFDLLLAEAKDELARKPEPKAIA
ncbi:wax ester synthase-like acyl-CoA acyltransferase domain-containing protein [Phycomyces nitens]|nr:wax ester synthase-like acyl-CoA acyltransferase domain-containing protein [Phycomyces nitens]